MGLTLRQVRFLYNLFHNSKQTRILHSIRGWILYKKPMSRF